MENFNDNPFARDTEVSIFTKNITIEDWIGKNCKKCKKSSECDIYNIIKKGELAASTVFNKKEFHYIYHYFTLPLHLAKRMEINYTDPLYQIGVVKEVCGEFDSGELQF